MARRPAPPLAAIPCHPTAPHPILQFRNMYESMLYLFVIHPYDGTYGIGDVWGTVGTHLTLHEHEDCQPMVCGLFTFSTCLQHLPLERTLRCVQELAPTPSLQFACASSAPRTCMENCAGRQYDVTHQTHHAPTSHPAPASHLMLRCCCPFCTLTLWRSRRLRAGGHRDVPRQEDIPAVHRHGQVRAVLPYCLS